MAKSPDAFRTISEVAEWLGTQAHVLRFWESKFSQVKPVKRAGGRRYYRPNDMMLLGGIKKLLHDDGLTIKGVQKVLRERGVKYVASLSPAIDDVPIPGPESNVVPIERAPEVVEGSATEVAPAAKPDDPAAEEATPEFSFKEIAPLEPDEPAAATPSEEQFEPDVENTLHVRALLRNPRVVRELDRDAIAPLVARLQALRDRMASPDPR